MSPPLGAHVSVAGGLALAFERGREIGCDALQIFGGNGLTREYPIEKIMRDARASMIEDGCNEVLSIVGASKLYE